LDTQQITCVVGDDHEVLRRGLVAVLEAEDDLRVIGQARDGRELLELAERRHPDVTIVDIAMPTVDGIAFCREITSRPNPPAVVLYTGNAEPDTLQSALEGRTVTAFDSSLPSVAAAAMFALCPT